MPKVSVIIPVYNVEKYLRECLDSVVHQTLSDIEIICIDDCSTDNSLSILKEYAQRDNRIKIIEQKENQGEVVAKYVGALESTSDYIATVDPDDYIMTDMCEIMYNSVVESQSDIAICNIQCVSENRCIDGWSKITQPISKEEYITPDNIFLLNPGTPNKLIKKELYLKAMNFSERDIWKDLYQYWRGVANNTFYKISYVNKELYFYRSNSDSITHIKKSKKMQFTEFCKTIDLILCYLKDNDLYDLWKDGLWENVNKLVKGYRLQKFGLKPFYSLIKKYDFDKNDLQKLKVSYIKWFIANIFSIKNNYSNNTKRKIITLFGLKFKFKVKTSYRNELYKSYADKYDKVIKKLKEDVKHRKLRVCFLVSEVAKWNMQNLYYEFKSSDIFEPFVLVSNLQDTNYRKPYDETLSFFKSCVDNVEIGWDEKVKFGIDIKKFKPDIIFYQQPWQIFPNQDIDYASDFALTCYFSYAIEDASDAIKNKVNSFLLKLWRYFVLSEDTKKQYRRELNYIFNNIIASGHPKLDVYKYYDENKYEHKYVIYAPHHSFEKHSLKWGTFKWNGKYILEWAKKHSELNWVFKPHPRFRFALINNNIMSENEVDEYYSEWAKIGEVCDSGNYFDLFKQSRCLITDCGSFLTEYLPTKQPVIRLVNKISKPLTDTNKKISKSYYQVKNIKMLKRTLLNILIKNIDTKLHKRMQVMRELHIDKPCFSKNIINEIRMELNI